MSLRVTYKRQDGKLSVSNVRKNSVIYLKGIPINKFYKKNIDGQRCPQYFFRLVLPVSVTTPIKTEISRTKLVELDTSSIKSLDYIGFPAFVLYKHFLYVLKFWLFAGLANLRLKIE